MAIPLHRRDSLIKEAKSTALVLTVLHVLAFVVMSVYRLHTRQYYVSEAIQAREAMENMVQQKISKSNPLEPLAAPLHDLSERLVEAHKSVKAQKEALLDHIQNLNVWKEATTSLLVVDGESEDENVDPDLESQLGYWRNLWSVGSLREISEGDLASVFGNATREILAILDENQGSGQQQQRIKRFVFDTSLGSGIPKEASEFVCPLVQTSKGPALRKQTKKVAAAYESDTETFLEVLEERFQNRIQSKGIDALFPESKSELEKTMGQKLHLVFNEIDEKLDSYESLLEENDVGDMESENAISGSSCVDENLVKELITTGLNAQVARTDVREALRNTLLEFDVDLSEDDIILDADLHSIGTSSNSRQRYQKTRIEKVNLRSMIDSPLLVKSVDWIDAFVDTIGGYNDEFDSYLDSLTNFHGTSSIGEILVENLLNRVGMLGDVDVQKHVDAVEQVLMAITGTR